MSKFNPNIIGEETTLCPEKRISSSIINNGVRDVLDLSTYVPFFLASVHNKLASGASAIYRNKFGIGIVDWRIIAMLAVEQGILAQRICEVIGIDKGAASKTLRTLLANGIVRCEVSKTNERIKYWWLSTQGFNLHDNIIKIAIKREEAVIDGVDASDLEAFLRVMRIMRKNLEKNISK